MPTASARTPAKAILAGEHFVLHGAPAVAVPVFERGLSLTATLEPGDALHLPDELAAHAGVIREHLPDLAGTISIRVESSIPQGSGLGSSAAFSVALAEALCELAGPNTGDGGDTGGTPDTPGAIAGAIEHAIHGRASGIDTNVIRRRVPIALELEDGAAEITPLPVPVPMRLLLVNSGIARRTAEQITAVGDRKLADPLAFERVAERVHEDTINVIEALAEGNAMMMTLAFFRLGEILTALDLDPDNAAAIRRITDAHSVALKITGAGGGGFLVGAAESPVSLNRAAAALVEAGYDAFTFDVRATG